MTHWTEIRTAYQVGRLGTVTAAAERLGVHRATVIRHIETLEAALGAKLFYRTTKGYTPTELGADMMRVAGATEEQFGQLAARAKGYETQLQGEFLITAVEAATPFILPVLSAFRREYSGLMVRFLVSERLLQLEHGEAHVAIRGGRKPTQPDLVVQPFRTVRLGLFAHQSYVAEHGLPRGPDDFARHHFIAPEGHGAPGRVFVWYRRHVPQERIVLRAANPQVVRDAVLAGLGIGFLPLEMAQTSPDFVAVDAPSERWSVNLWLVTHRDLHRSAKVQAFTRLFKSAPSWGVTYPGASS